MMFKKKKGCKFRSIQELKGESIRYITGIEPLLYRRIIDDIDQVKACHRSRGKYFTDILLHKKSIFAYNTFKIML